MMSLPCLSSLKIGESGVVLLTSPSRMALFDFQLFSRQLGVHVHLTRKDDITARVFEAMP